MSSDPAFPVSTSDGTQGHQDGDDTWQFPGMSLRDFFAAKAMASFVLAACTDLDAASAMGEPSVIASRAYEFADFMLMAREA